MIYRIAQTSRENPVESLVVARWVWVSDDMADSEGSLLLDDRIGLVGVDEWWADGHADGGHNR